MISSTEEKLVEASLMIGTTLRLTRAIDNPFADPLVVLRIRPGTVGFLCKVSRDDAGVAYWTRFLGYSDLKLCPLREEEFEFIEAPWR